MEVSSMVLLVPPSRNTPTSSQMNAGNTVGIEAEAVAAFAKSSNLVLFWVN